MAQFGVRAPTQLSRMGVFGSAAYTSFTDSRGAVEPVTDTPKDDSTPNKMSSSQAKQKPGVAQGASARAAANAETATMRGASPPWAVFSGSCDSTCTATATKMQTLRRCRSRERHLRETNVHLERELVSKESYHKETRDEDNNAPSTTTVACQ